jgi:hypothetical protein
MLRWSIVPTSKKVAVRSGAAFATRCTYKSGQYECLRCNDFGLSLSRRSGKSKLLQRLDSNFLFAQGPEDRRQLLGDGRVDVRFERLSPSDRIERKLELVRFTCSFGNLKESGPFHI